MLNQEPFKLQINQRFRQRYPCPRCRRLRSSSGDILVRLVLRRLRPSSSSMLNCFTRTSGTGSGQGRCCLMMIMLRKDTARCLEQPTPATLDRINQVQIWLPPSPIPIPMKDKLVLNTDAFRALKGHPQGSAQTSQKIYQVSTAQNLKKIEEKIEEKIEGEFENE